MNPLPHPHPRPHPRPHPISSRTHRCSSRPFFVSRPEKWGDFPFVRPYVRTCPPQSL